MAGYSVKRIDGRKVYESADQKLVVWSVQTCIKKLATALDKGEIGNVFSDAATWQAKQEEIGPMHKQWAADCCKLLEKVWDKYGYDVKTMVPEMTPPPAEVEPPKAAPKLGLFKRG